MGHRILITGGAGYIGSILVPELLKDKHHVTVLDNFLFRENSLAQVCADPNFDLINGDVRDEKLLSKLVKDVDMVIPLAALVGAPLCAKDPVAATTVNRDSVVSLFKKLRKDQWILMPISNSVYGKGNKDSIYTEESPLNPISLYAKHKVEVEAVLMEHENAISFRLATVFGMSPRMRIDLLVNDFVYRAVKDRNIVLFESQFKRNFIHLRDVAKVFQFAIANFDRLKGQIYNVGLDDGNLNKLELCHVIKKHIQNLTIIEAPIGVDLDQRNYIVSNQKINAAGFSPKHPLESGIQELIKGYSMIHNSRYTNV